MIYNPELGLPKDDETMCTLEQQYGGEAQRNIKSYGRKDRSLARLGRLDVHAGSRTRRLNFKRMEGMKGCFVCGKDHLARQDHNREEVTTTIKN